LTGHLTLFLVCFSVCFSRFYQQNRGVLHQLPMISRHLYWFLYLSLQFYSSRNIAMLGCSWRRNQVN